MSKIRSERSNLSQKHKDLDRFFLNTDQKQTILDFLKKNSTDFDHAKTGKKQHKACGSLTWTFFFTSIVKCSSWINIWLLEVFPSQIQKIVEIAAFVAFSKLIFWTANANKGKHIWSVVTIFSSFCWDNQFWPRKKYKIKNKIAIPREKQ